MAPLLALVITLGVLLDHLRHQDLPTILARLADRSEPYLVPRVLPLSSAAPVQSAPMIACVTLTYLLRSDSHLLVNYSLVSPWGAKGVNCPSPNRPVLDPEICANPMRSVNT